MQYKVKHRHSGESETLDKAAFEALSATFTGRRKVTDLYDVQEVKEPKKPEPLADEASAKSSKSAKTEQAG